MKATTVELLGLFQTDVRYLVPIFQRNYRWSEAAQWAPLWADVRDVAEDILDFGDGPEIADHFLGAVVCEEQKSFGIDPHAWALIDGQQRLTTLQLLLSAMHRVARQREFDWASDYLANLVENQAAVVQGREPMRYKLWPNVADRIGFASAMRGETGSTRPQEATRFFEETIGVWLDVGIEEDPLDDAENTPEERMQALLTAVARHLKLVKIDLEQNDSAQVIFETLNARSEPLTDADLIRNHLFRLADEQKIDAEALHGSHWSRFDDPKWQAKVAHGRHQRERVLLLLNSWLSMRLVREVPAARIFRTFKEYVGEGRLEAVAVAEDISVNAEVFDSFGRFERDSYEWWFFRRLAEMDLITVYPLLLWLFGQSPESLPTPNRQRALRAVESFLGRRLLARESTRSYGDVFVRVLQAAAAGPIAEADKRIIELLDSNTADADRWPSDDNIRTVVLNTNVYKLKQSRLAMILSAIDRQMVDNSRQEFVSLGNSLWIEHLLPQTWRGTDGWRIPADLEDPTKFGLERDHIVHTLGNLTLTTAKLDIELSNRPWSEKRDSIDQFSVLALNRDVVQRYPDEWSEAQIRDRGSRLAEVLIEAWPGPDTLRSESSA